MNLSDILKQGTLLLDGAMGTELINLGADPAACKDHLNIQSPDMVLQVQTAYVNAGSNALLTNTFGANPISLARYNLADSTTRINKAAAKIARKAAGQNAFVLGDIGPSGKLLEPLGDVNAGQLKEAFTTQAAALLEAGVDGFIIETMTALEEIEIAVRAVKSLSDDVPVFASLAYDPAGESFRTMMGVSCADAVERLAPLGPAAIGFNCGGLNMDQYIKLAAEYASALQDRDIALLAEPNAGSPQLEDEKPVYKLSPEDFAEAAQKIKNAGAKIIGGCCGTTPQHIKALVEKLK